MREYTKEDCLWLRLRESGKPVVLYGTGNGADKILDVCERYGIKVDGVFASGGFVRDRYFRGFHVESLEDIEKRLGDFTVLLCFGTTLPEVAAQIEAAAARHELYIPDVPLYGGELFDFEYYEKNREKLRAARELLCDEASRELFDDIIGFRLSGRREYLANAENPEESYKRIIAPHIEKGGLCIDCGAFTGDSAAALSRALPLGRIAAIEADVRSFKKLSEFAENNALCEIVPVNAAVGEVCGETEFTFGGSRASGTLSTAKRTKTVTVPLVTVDSIAKEQKLSVSVIKYDVEGDEAAALCGSRDTISAYHPALAVSVYHRSADIFDLPVMIKNMYSGYGFYLRRTPCIPAWDITLFAVEGAK